MGVAAAAESEQIETLLLWAAEIGVTDGSSSSSPPRGSCLGHSLAISYFPTAGGRGLGAARDLRKGELMLRVPRAALVTRESVLARNEKLAAAVQRFPGLSSTQILTVCLLAEAGKRKDSWWYHYLLHLPRRYDILASFSEFAIRALQVDDAIWVAEKAVHKAKSEWKATIALMQLVGFRRELQTFKSWLWASATISSRTLHIPWDDGGCLCPIGDLFNYTAPEEETCSENRLTDGRYEEDSHSYCFYARRNYQKNEQVLLSYGTYTNLELLEHYGFLLDMNPNDKAFIPLDGDLQALSSWPKDTMYILPDGSPSFALLCMLRLWATPPNLRRNVRCHALTGSVLSVENDLVIFKWLENRCWEVLRKMPSTAKDDELLLVRIGKISCTSDRRTIEEQSFQGELLDFIYSKGLDKSHLYHTTLPEKTRTLLERWRLAVLWRLNYKTMLLHCVSYCNKMIDQLSSQLNS